VAGREWSASHPCHFIPPPRTHWIGTWLDPRAGLDDVERPHWDRDSDPLIVQPVVSRYTDYAIPAPSLNGNVSIMLMDCIQCDIPLCYSGSSYYVSDISRNFHLLITETVLTFSLK
jgi:hypothetical protein